MLNILKRVVGVVGVVAVLVVGAAGSASAQPWSVTSESDLITDVLTTTALVEVPGAGGVFQVTMTCANEEYSIKVAAYTLEGEGNRISFTESNTLRFVVTRADDSPPGDHILAVDGYNNVGRLVDIFGGSAEVFDKLPTTRLVLRDVFPGDTAVVPFSELSNADRELLTAACFESVENKALRENAEAVEAEAVAAAAAAREAAIVAEAARADADAAAASNVSGMVMFDGELPAAEALMMNSDPVCAMSATNTMSSTFVGSGGHLGNVFVYVKSGHEGQTFPAAGGTVELNQQGCRFTPHVMGIQVGQTLTITNSDPTLHNINATPAVNDGFNMGQPMQGMTSERTFDSPEVMVPLKCDVHGWMNAYVGVMDHPYFSVTGPDGAFDLAGLLPGDYVVEAWHESLGTQTQNVTVATGQTATVSFTFAQ